MSLVTFNSENATSSLFIQYKEEFFEFENSQSTTFLRSDYKEVLELCVFYLKGRGLRQFCFMKCDALHKARWMSKIIYSIKISLLSREILRLPMGTIVTSANQLLKVERFVTFIVYIYIPWWFKAICQVDAPYNDIEFIRKARSFNEIDSLVSTSVLRTFSRHLWYLTEEFIPISLFSDISPDSVKREFVETLLKVQYVDNTLPKGRFGAGYGEPKFPSLTKCTTLKNLVGEDSYFVFKLLRISVDFITIPVEEWRSSQSYQQARYLVKSLNVVNDSAERSVN